LYWRWEYLNGIAFSGIDKFAGWHDNPAIKSLLPMEFCSGMSGARFKVQPDAYLNAISSKSIEGVFSVPGLLKIP
jgi:hypothetical protein